MGKGVSIGIMSGLLLLALLASGSISPAPVATVSLFERRCASCHGKEGALFPERFAAKYRHESELEAIIKSMPGATALGADGIPAMVAYMRAISQQEPYIIWTDKRADLLEGEIAPSGASLKASAKRKALKVERPSGNRWRIRLPAKVKLEEVELVAQHGTRRTTLRLKDSPYSHAE
jgi:hypothetical protein